MATHSSILAWRIPMDRGVWWATVHGVTELDTTERLSLWGFPGGSDGKESACNMEDLGLIPGWEDPLEEGMATHSSILAWRIPKDRGAWWATVHGVTKNQTQLSN